MNRLHSGTRQPADTDRAKLNRAFRRITEMGGAAVTGLCCQGCGWDLIQQRQLPDAAPKALVQDAGERQAFGSASGAMLLGPLPINHGGDSQQVFGALEAEGLAVVWDGNPQRVILVVPRVLH